MRCAADIPGIYVEILEASKRMLSLAEKGDWDALVEQELVQQALVGGLKSQLEVVQRPFPAEVDASINDITLEILALDTAIRQLVGDRLKDLGEFFRSNKNSQRLNSIYRKS